MCQMLERDRQQSADVVVVESVVDVAAIATVPDDPRSAEQAERLGHLGFARADVPGNLVDAHLLGGGEGFEDANPSRITEQSKQRGRFVGEVSLV